ncbi:copper chaperone for superoxide dismutase, chloroplastic [Iris pallida]|uniref:Superoxide dismutase copper chaperone n=1 Tax=Iris pallida TaxID=29817 RepID=A0AAX6HGJ5_IRIPA|nr:copper chaperone for superoxide dismutase, chloroplastic [Iris pallida]
MVSFVRTFTATSPLPIPTAIAAASLYSSSFQFPRKAYFSFFTSVRSAPNPSTSSLIKTLDYSRPALRMDSQAATIAKPAADEVKAGVLPELMTEFMVDMKCEGCVSSVKNNLLKLDGVKNVDVDLSNQVVRVLGSLPVKTMIDALEQTGRKTKLIGQGNPNDFLVSAAVAEFKGPIIFGVVRLAQVNMELARIEASFSGLSPGKHGWAIHEFGDLTSGAVSTGKVYNPADQLSEVPLGDLGTLEAQENGEANFSGAKQMLRVADLIGRSIVVYGSADKSDSGIAAAVIARSAGVGENYKKLCTCDGVTIWESS